MRNGLIRPLPNWPQSTGPPATPPPRGGGVRIPRPLLVILVLYVGAFLSPLRAILDEPLGWGAILLAYLVLRELGAHFADGGGRGGFKALAEYAAVGLLVFALLTASAALPKPPASKAPAARSRPPAEQAQADPLADLREWWRKVSAGAPEITFPAKEGR